MSEAARDKTPAAVRPPPRCRLRVMGLLIIFASGVVTGWAVPKLLLESPERARSIEGMRDKITERIDDRVDLSDEQIEQVRKIVEQRLLAWHELRKRIEPEMTVQMEQMHTQIAAILNDKQKAKWEEYYAEMRERWQFGADTQPATRAAPSTQPGE